MRMSLCNLAQREEEELYRSEHQHRACDILHRGNQYQRNTSAQLLRRRPAQQTSWLHHRNRTPASRNSRPLTKAATFMACGVGTRHFIDRQLSRLLVQRSCLPYNGGICAPVSGILSTQSAKCLTFWRELACCAPDVLKVVASIVGI